MSVFFHAHVLVVVFLASTKDYEARTARAAKTNILHSFADGRQLGATGRTTQVTRRVCAHASVCWIIDCACRVTDEKIVRNFWVCTG